MKPICFLLIALMASSFSFSQTSISLRKPTSFTGAIEAVLSDFPNNLRTISGEKIMSQGEVENYASLVVIPGAEDCMITRYHSIEDSTASWQARMLRTEDFKKASSQYKNFYKQLRSCQLKLVDGSVVYMNGEWEAPEEEKDFVTSTLRLATGDSRYKEVKIDLEMLYQFPEWVININVVSKKKDTLEDY